MEQFYRKLQITGDSRCHLLPCVVEAGSSELEDLSVHLHVVVRSVYRPRLII